MAKHTFPIPLSLLLLFLLSLLFHFSNGATSYNVMSFGAKPDGKTDSTQAFLRAWAKTCNTVQGPNVTMYVPSGRFLLKAVEFTGPCKSKIEVRIDGTIVAPSDYRALGNSGSWILFNKVNRLKVTGGTIDAKGAGYWACRASGKSCPAGARSITFNWANHVVLSGLTSINSQIVHVSINSCNNVLIRNVKITAPDNSPNTDGIHLQLSTGVTITSSTIKTGDDCISIGPGTRNLMMDRIECGPGHGVSIGSLARDYNEDGVQNVTLSNSVFTGTDNGVRIKTWARASKAYVRDIVFQNIQMRNVTNPIIIDQNYCPYNKDCPGQTSGVNISRVTYKNIQGTSASQVAVVFDCSPSSPCKGIKLQDIKLTYSTKQTKAVCNNISGTSSGISDPQSCL